MPYVDPIAAIFLSIIMMTDKANRDDETHRPLKTELFIGISSSCLVQDGAR